MAPSRVLSAAAHDTEDWEQEGIEATSAFPKWPARTKYVEYADSVAFNTWTRGGPHFQSQCPKAAPKGGGRHPGPSAGGLPLQHASGTTRARA